MNRWINCLGLCLLVAFSWSAHADDAEAKLAEEKDEPKVMVPMAGSGLVGQAKVGGRDCGIMFHYTHGMIFNPEPVRSRIDGDFVLTLTGSLEVPEDLVVKVFHAGGGVSHDVNTLFVDGEAVSSVGDDRSKHAVDELELTAGVHTVRWQMTGGTFRNNLLKFVDPETDDLIPLRFVTEEVPDDPIREFVRVGTDKRGWPIPADW